MHVYIMYLYPYSMMSDTKKKTVSRMKRFHNRHVVSNFVDMIKYLVPGMSYLVGVVNVVFPSAKVHFDMIYFVNS